VALAGGQSATGYVIVSDLAKTTDTLKFSPAAGVTAANGGAAYASPSSRCSGTGCWVTGLPGVVTLSAGAYERIGFTMRVPHGTPNGQYLAGITAQPATRPRSVRVGSNGKATARAVIIPQVTVGVVVTVGALSRLRTRFLIPGVTGEIIGPNVRLNIHLDNTGQTFARAAGGASCTAAGTRHSFAVAAGTILPHQGAEIAVNTPGLTAGTTVPCTVRLHYGKGQTVSWAGLVMLPAASSARIVHTGPGAYSAVPEPGIPLWAKVLGALLIAAIAVAAWALLLRWRQVRLSNHP
jgi:hypothetical protein